MKAQSVLRLRRVQVPARTAMLLFIGSAVAAPLPSRDRLGSEQSGSRIELVQFAWRGHDYCWYLDGWRGPGWYWCGYSARAGLGWGGPVGWHGWRNGAKVEETRGRQNLTRPGGGSDHK